MGCHANVTNDHLPRQGRYLNRRVEVTFHYGPDVFHGSIVRDDDEEPFRTVVRLDDGRYVLAGECQYRVVTDEEDILDAILREVSDPSVEASLGR